MRSRLPERRGAALIWALITLLVLSLLIAGGLLIASVYQQRGLSERTDTQAYYTAVSVTKTMASWIADERAAAQKDGKTSADFLDWLKTREKKTTVVDIPQTELPYARGACRVTFTLNGADNAELRIETTAEYADSVYTMSLDMNQRGLYLPGFSFPVSDFSRAEYDREAESLNGIATDGFADDYLRRTGTGTDTIVPTGNQAFDDAYGLGHYLPDITDDVGAPFNHRAEDSEILNRLITDPLSSIEATYGAAPSSPSLPAEITGSMRVSGTRDSNSNSMRAPGLADFADAHFASGANGRIAVNPERAISVTDGETYYSENENAPDNTKLNNFRVDGLAGKPQIRIRLTEEDGAGSSQTFRGAFVNFDFTDNADVAAESIRDQNGNVLFDWYPQDWDGARIFTRGENRNPDETVDVDLLFGPYANTYQYGSLDAALDYYGWGLYRNKHVGTEAGDLARLVPQLVPLDGYTAETQPGMPIVPTYWGKDVGLYLLDGDVERSAWIMQGVNIIEGTVYSYRSLTVGGSLTASGYPMTGKTVEGYNSTVPGYSDGTTYDRAVYTNFIPRFNQTIADTDIILLAPGVTGGDRRASVIKSPSATPMDTLLGRADIEDEATLLTRDFSVFQQRRTDIVGGTIYVGAGQDLTIEGVTEDGDSVFTAVPNVKRHTESGDYSDYTTEGRRLNVAPDRIIVTEDATLTVEASAYRTVDTDIYVEGGVLTIREGANIRGDIYCYNGGRVVIEGDFTMDADASAEPEDRGKSGVYIYGSDAVGTNGEARGAGDIEIPQGTVIDGDSGGVHYMSDEFSDERYDVCVCDDHDAETLRCKHFGNPERGWRIGRYGTD